VKAISSGGSGALAASAPGAQSSPDSQDSPERQDSAERQGSADRQGSAGPRSAPGPSGAAAAEREEHVEQMDEAARLAAAQAEETGGLGRPGPPLNKRSPFFIGMAGAAGVAVTYGLVELFIRARSVLVLIGLALFIAAGLDPAVSWLTRRRVPRMAAVLAVLLAVAGVAAGFLAAAIPPLSAQAHLLAAELPHYAHELQDHNSQLGRLNLRYHIQQRLSHLISTKGSSLLGGVLGAGELVLSAVTSILVLIVLVIYFLASMPRIKMFIYRLAPHSRRPRVMLLGDEILTKVGGFVLGNFVTSVIAGIGTYIWLVAFGVPYPLLLAFFVALMDLIPVIGSTIGGAVVSLIALAVSLPVAIGTLCFYIGYRLAEDYLIVPRIMGKTVRVPAVVSIVAVLVGGALMGIIGALVAIPVAAALRLLLLEITFRRLDRS
jgi:predicted PurR-regulated permease PerM